MNLGFAVEAKDQWISVKSANFNLIGNAGEKEIREAAAKLEQFRETFKLLFPRAKFEQSIETNVIVFKSAGSYRPFKPKRPDGKPDDDIAGYFQPGEDVNYITLSTEGSRDETYGTIFHEYVHFLIDTHFGRSSVPPWFNEGLAEFYQTFEIENDQRVFLGRLQQGHLYQLQRTKLIPFRQFFEIDNYSLHMNGSHSRSIFYAQAWALMHYLIQSGQSQNLSSFLALVMDEVKPEAAFKQAFGLDYAAMEKTLEDYVRQRKFQVRWVEFERKLDFGSEMTVRPLTEADANAYLGDLLYHRNENDDAETYLKQSLAAEPNHTLANTSYGLVQMRKRNFELARKHLEIAVASDRRNHFAQYSYAYVLSRESMDAFGFVSRFESSTAEKMRQALKTSIDIMPSFAPSYQLLAFINLVNGEDLDGALEYLRKGIAYQPGNPEYSLLMAKIYLRQEKYDEAEKLAETIARTAAAEEIRSDAEQVLNTVKQFRKSLADIERQAQEATGSSAPPLLLKRSEISEEDIQRVRLEQTLNRLNRLLPDLGADEKRVIGRLEKLQCVNGTPRFLVSTDDGKLRLVSKDFAGLYLLMLDEEEEAVEVGCDSDLSHLRAVLTYRPPASTPPADDGTLLSIAFVPEFFRLKSEEEINGGRPVVIVDDKERQVISEEEFRKRRTETMLEALAKALRKPAPGETRVLGVLKGVECQRKYTLYLVESAGKQIRLRSDPKETLQIITYTQDTERVQFRCGMVPPSTRAVVTYRPVSEKDLEGSIVALEFVPDAFQLKDAK